MKIRNISDQALHFTGIGTIEAGDTMNVPQDIGEQLLRNPNMAIAEPVKSVEEEPAKPAKKSHRSMRGVEAE